MLIPHQDYQYIDFFMISYSCGSNILFINKTLQAFVIYLHIFKRLTCTVTFEILINLRTSEYQYIFRPLDVRNINASLDLRNINTALDIRNINTPLDLRNINTSLCLRNINTALDLRNKPCKYFIGNHEGNIGIYCSLTFSI